MALGAFRLARMAGGLRGAYWDGALAGARVGALLWFIASLLFRWRFQFSIQSLLVLTLAVAVPCSWLAVEMREVRQERKTAAEFKNLRGDVRWSEPSGPDWLRRLLGIISVGR